MFKLFFSASEPDELVHLFFLPMLPHTLRLAISRQREVGAFGGLSADHPNQQLLGEEQAPAGQGGGQTRFILAV